MEIKYFDIGGPFEMVPDIFKDDRGIFFESFRAETFSKLGIDKAFIQDNHSFSYKNVLRGIHFQLNPHEQGKLVRVTYGKAYDVAVDLRPGSDTFGKYISVILDSKLNNMFYIPEGFGHGFVALEDCILQYKCTTYYHSPSDTGIRWDDRDLEIDWPVKNPILSKKDTELPSFKSFIDNNI
jgi:dTDP-4-dehydrorhamnose 3,5-epimerase